MAEIRLLLVFGISYLNGNESAVREKCKAYQLDTNHKCVCLCVLDE